MTTKSTAEHTLWRVNGSESSTAIWIEDANGTRIATVKNCERDADYAKLIADAPETAAERDRLREENASLIEAAELLLRQYDSSGDFTMGGNLTNEPFLKFRAALARHAKGE